MITHFQVPFLGLQLAARNILFDAFHILTPYDVAYEKSFSFMNMYIVFNNYSSSPNGLWINSPWGWRPNGLLTQKP